ncbi:hypothetical protein [Candidiatus Paracoxiella cheracis]|uniref:hypothetical protein n=1 Tax=Candidiatus Paracoxiella cheracis TaxID=3405120 RepID=UPI003BF4BD99
MILYYFLQNEQIEVESEDIELSSEAMDTGNQGGWLADTTNLDSVGLPIGLVQDLIDRVAIDDEYPGQVISETGLILGYKKMLIRTLEYITPNPKILELLLRNFTGTVLTLIIVPPEAWSNMGDKERPSMGLYRAKDNQVLFSHGANLPHSLDDFQFAKILRNEFSHAAITAINQKRSRGKTPPEIVFLPFLDRKGMNIDETRRRSFLDTLEIGLNRMRQLVSSLSKSRNSAFHSESNVEQLRAFRCYMLRTCHICINFFNFLIF